MKNGIKILLGGVLLFGIITLATTSLDYDADGADRYGFPLNFYTKVTGYNEITMEGGTSIEFDTLNFICDLAVASLLSWLMLLTYRKLRRRKTLKSENQVRS